MEQLQEFEFTIIHRPGKAHCNADALSRRHCSKDCSDTHSTATIVAVTTPIGYSHAELCQAQLEDPIIREILQAKQGNCKPATEHAKGQNLEYRRLFQQWEQLTVSDGILWREYAQPREDRGWTQLVVPKKFRQDILRDLHEGMTGGHLGEVKTLSKLKERIYWPGHYNDVRDWCQTCKACAKRKSPVPGRQAPMHTITAGYPTQVMAVDLLGPLTESKNGNCYVLVIGDYFSRCMEALPVPNQEASTVAKKLVDEVFLRFSPPEQLHSDQGRQFESKLVMEVCKLLHINKTRTTPYHPQCDGLVERFNRTLLHMLATCTEDHPGDWEQHIRKVCMAYNASVHPSTGFSPFYLMFGQQARLPIDLIYGTGPQVVENQSVGEYAVSLKSRVSAAFDLVRRNVSQHHVYQKELYDWRVHGQLFSTGDWVWLYSPVVGKGGSRKLNCPWKGPYTVIKKISDVTYRIQNLQRRKDRQVVHFNRLKPCPKDICLEGENQPATQPSQSRDAAPQTRPTPSPSDIELVEEDDVIFPTIGLRDTNSNPQPTSLTVRRNPPRARRLPQRYGDAVYH